MKKTLLTSPLLVFLLLFWAACGGSESGNNAGTTPPADPSGLTQAQLEKGIGPITSVTLGPVDDALATQGLELFTLKCSACHKVDQRYIGPALGDVTSRRTPEFIMNMILNPEEMVQKHPEAKKLLAEYMAPMANQNLTEDEARAILEYLRQVGAAQ